MTFLIVLGYLIGLGSGLVSIYQFLQQHKASGTIYIVVAAVFIGAAILITILPTQLDSAASGNHQPGKTPVSVTAPQQETTVTTVPTTPATTAPTQNPTPTSAATSEYSAAQPGPHCDTNGGVWTEQELNQIQCANGTAISSNYNTLGYLYLQLPNNAPFSPTNKLSIMGSNLDYDDGYVCLGLAEQGTNAGVLVEFCGNGGWFIYSLSGTGCV